MKRIVLLLVMLCFIPVAEAQIKVVNDNVDCQDVGEVKSLMSPIAKITKCQTEDVVSYAVHYKDIEFQHLTEFKHFSFLEKENDFETLYKLIIEGFSNPPKNDIIIELQKGTVHLHFEKNLGVVSFQFIHFPFGDSSVMGRSAYLTKKQVNKLFGK